MRSVEHADKMVSIMITAQMHMFLRLVAGGLYTLVERSSGSLAHDRGLSDYSLVGYLFHRLHVLGMR